MVVHCTHVICPAKRCCVRQGRRTLARRRKQAAAAQQQAGAAQSLAPPVPAGTGLAFPEFAAALRAQQVAKQQLRLQAARQRGNIWAASADDAAAGDTDDYDNDDGGGEDTHVLLRGHSCWGRNFDR